MQPMLANPTRSLPGGAGWAHEVKWDGMRILADVREGRATLSARSSQDASGRFPELGRLTDHADALFDGEVVALERGVPSFSRLIHRIHARDGAAAAALAARAPVTYVVFDVLRLDGVDLTSQPWARRREVLQALDFRGAPVIVPPTYDDGAALLDATAAQGLEGVVSKRVDSPYTPGRRSPHWLKLPHRPTASVVVGGWRPETGDPGRLGALLVGRPAADGTLRFVGRVGSGLGAGQALHLNPALRDLAADSDPFTPRTPRVDARGAHWVRPELVVDVRSLGSAGLSDGRLRQPAYHGIRVDLTPDDLVADGSGPAAAVDSAADEPDAPDGPGGDRG